MNPVETEVVQALGEELAMRFEFRADGELLDVETVEELVEYMCS